MRSNAVQRMIRGLLGHPVSDPVRAEEGIALIRALHAQRSADTPGMALIGELLAGHDERAGRAVGETQRLELL